MAPRSSRPTFPPFGFSSMSVSADPTPTNAYPWYSPRFWHGMRMGEWWNLLADNGFALGLRGLPPAIAISCFSVFNSTMSFLQWVFHGRAIHQTKIDKPPVFILGHWRSGTT